MPHRFARSCQRSERPEVGRRTVEDRQGQHERNAQGQQRETEPAEPIRPAQMRLDGMRVHRPPQRANEHERRYGREQQHGSDYTNDRQYCQPGAGALHKLARCHEREIGADRDQHVHQQRRHDGGDNPGNGPVAPPMPSIRHARVGSRPQMQSAPRADHPDAQDHQRHERSEQSDRHVNALDGIEYHRSDEEPEQRVQQDVQKRAHRERRQEPPEWNPKHAAGDHRGHAQTGRQSAGHYRGWPVPHQPALGAVESLWRQVDVAAVAVDKLTAGAGRGEIQARGAQQGR